jgi:hypothetical protein
MRVTGPSPVVKMVVVGAIALVAATALPAAAEAQARGSLQAQATVVDTRQGFNALQAVRSALELATQPRAESQQSVATVAQVSVDRPRANPGAVVVTIDYSRN